MATIAPFSGLSPRPKLPLEDLLTPGTGDLTGLGGRPSLCLPDLVEEYLRQEDSPCYYAYRVDYRTVGGLEKSRLGLIARLDPFNIDARDVLTAVDAAPGLVDASVEHLQSTGLKSGLVVAGYEDAQFEVERILVRGLVSSPIVCALPGEKHTVWPLRNHSALEELTAYFAQRECFLFDGVHHFRAARRVRDTAPGDRDPGEPTALYPLALLVNVYDFGVSLGAYHYLVPPAGDFDLNTFVLTASAHFDVKTYRWGEGYSREHAFGEFQEDFRIHATSRIVVGAYFPGERQFFLFSLKEDIDRVSVLPPDVSSLLHGFAIVFLRRVFLEQYWWKGEANRQRWNDVALTPDMEDAVKRADEDDFGAAFFLHPPHKRSLVNLARKGKRLPIGSVRLDPTHRCGLVMDRLTTSLSPAGERRTTR